MRQMPDGQWVAFDYGTDRPHSHHKPIINKKRSHTSTKHRSKNKPRKKEAIKKENILTRKGQTIDPFNIPHIWISLTPKNLSLLLPHIIRNKRKLIIKYTGRDGETERTIYPTSLTTVTATVGKIKLHAYCSLRKDRRTFSLTGIKELKIGSSYNSIPEPSNHPTTSSPAHKTKSTHQTNG